MLPRKGNGLFVAPGTLPNQPIGSCDCAVASKGQKLAELMNRPETYDKFGSAWRLAVRLLCAHDGMLLGTYEDIARQLGDVSRDSVRNWIKALEGSGVIVTKQEGWQLTIRLIGEYMDIATAPDQLQPDAPTITTVADSKMIGIEKLLEGTRDLGGAMTITINVGNAENVLQKKQN